MGVFGLPLLISEVFSSPTYTLDTYDCILVDIQSTIYSKLAATTKHNAKDIIEDVCQHTYLWFLSLLRWIFDEPSASEMTIVIAFDGPCVPMKWPLQKYRRQNTSLENDCDLLKISLFECNIFSERVYEYFKTQLKASAITNPPDYLPPTLFFILDGSQNPGEGEHKLFYTAEEKGFQNLLVVSVDNDVFFIALARWPRVQSVHVLKYSEFKPSSIYPLKNLSVRPEIVFYAGFLFGNDFIPEIVKLTPTNVTVLKEIIESIDPYSSIPGLLYHIVQRLRERRKIRYTSVDDVSDRILIEFWKNCLWMRDYYQKQDFPQKYMRNVFYDMFDRNRILSGFENVRDMEDTFRDAQQEYHALRPTSQPSPDHVFTKEQLNVLQPYILKPSTKTQVDTFTWKISPQETPQITMKRLPFFSDKP